MKELKLKRLEKSHEEGALTKEEFEKKKKEIEDMPEEKATSHEEPESESGEKDVPLKSEWMLFLIVGIIVVVLAALLGLAYFKSQEPPKTIDDLHELNFAGKLNKEQGFIYHGQYSFVFLEGVWYTRFTSPTEQTLYSLNFRFSPRDLENITIDGALDGPMFNNASEYYVTFNPVGSDFGHLRLARFDFDTQMTNVFGKKPLSACDRDASNQTAACQGIPMVTCENRSAVVVHFRAAKDLQVRYDRNCIIIEGKEFDYVKGVDRVLYNLYGIME